MSIKNLLFTLILWMGLPVIGLSQKTLEVQSPNQEVVVYLSMQEGHAFYNIHYKGQVFLENSPLGLETSIGNFTKDLTIVGHAVDVKKGSYRMKKYKDSQISYDANELTVSLLNKTKDTLEVIFWVSNHDVAFSYRVKGAHDQTNIKIFKEHTGFNLPDDASIFLSSQARPMTGWKKTKPSYEEEYLFDKPVGTPSKYGVGFTFPGLFKLHNQEGWLLISETGVDGHYVGSRLGEGNKDGLYKLHFPQKGENNGIGATYVAQALPAKTPWRTITLGTTLKPIVESTIALDVVKPQYQPSWNYQFGRSAWSWIVWKDGSINYEDQIKYIDMAAALNFQYVLIDNWWDQKIGRGRMKELVDYAASKGIGILLWYNSNGYWNDAPQTPQDKMNTALARSKEMTWLENIGVKGIKVDFFGGDKQTTMQLYEDILVDADKHHLLVTFHGATIPRGWLRMFPNYVTSEAVLASENITFTQEHMNKHALRATLTPFIRNAVGPMDFGPVFLNKRLTRDQKGGVCRVTTDAFELATAVLYFSPIQYFGLTPNNLEEKPKFELDFMKKVPTTWDKTLYLGGQPGKYCAIARRKNQTWYVAIVNGEKKEKEVTLDLSMLKSREIQLIYDKEGLSAGQKEIQIAKNKKFKVHLLPDGGAVIVGH